MPFGRTILLLALVAAVAFAVAQNTSLIPPSPPNAAELEDRVEALENQLKQMEARVVQLEAKLKPRLELLK